MKKRYSIPLILLTVFVLIFIFYWIYSNIFFYSYLSVTSVCNEEKFKIDYPTYHVVGEVSISQVENKTEIKVYIADKTDIPTVKHELCHLRQYRQHRIFGCDHQILKFITEVECYSVENFYELFY